MCVFFGLEIVVVVGVGGFFFGEEGGLWVGEKGGFWGKEWRNGGVDHSFLWVWDELG